MATKKTTQPRLTLAGLLGALSFWGTSARLLLMAFLAGVVLLARIINLPTSYEAEAQAFIYIVGSFALLDAGYVMLARAFSQKRSADVMTLLLIDTAIGLLYIVPNFVNAPSLTRLSGWTLLIALFVLCVRALVGLLSASPRK